MSTYIHGCDVCVGVDTIPQVGKSYTDHDTVLAVQKALKEHGFDPGPIDGEYGPKTQKAVKLLQASVDAGQTGVIDYGVLMTLGVPAPEARAKSVLSRLNPFAPPTTQAAPVPASTGFWSQPMWSGAPVKRWQGAVGIGAGAAMVLGLVLVKRR